MARGFVELDAAWEVEMERRGLAAATRAAYGRVARSYLVFLEGCGIVELVDADGASTMGQIDILRAGDRLLGLGIQNGYGANHHVLPDNS
jgi:hypothetical protein